MHEVNQLNRIGVLALLAGSASPGLAATLCVDPGKIGCYGTIGAAVLHATPGDTIEVAQGKYQEDVVIGKSLSLIGKNVANTVIDATGLANGVYIDGLDHPGLTGVTVTGFTIENANFEGVLITNASNVTLQNNRIVNNDRNLNVATLTCPGLPAFETNEDFDCGEGVHISGLSNSTISANTIENNSGGILVSDETGPTHDNLIASNVVRNNVLDCGITIPSHQPGVPGVSHPFGIYKNTIAGNDVSGNGVQEEGAGIGLFAFQAGGRVSDNLITGNRITNNGLPGVTFHAHQPFNGNSPPENLNNNVITGNYIAGNGEDSEDAATPGRTGINVFGFGAITGTVIMQNVIKDEDADIVVNTPAPAVVDAHFNNLNGPAIGVANLSTAIVSATNNWWGCSQGPNSPGCASTTGLNIQVVPWLSSPVVPNGSPNAQH